MFLLWSDLTADVSKVSSDKALKGGVILSCQYLFQKCNDPALKVYEKEIELMCAMQRLNQSHKKKVEHEAVEKEREREKEREKQERRNAAESSAENSATTRKRNAHAHQSAAAPDASSVGAGGGKGRITESVDDLIDLAKTLASFTVTPHVNVSLFVIILTIQYDISVDNLYYKIICLLLKPLASLRTSMPSPLINR